MTTNFVHVVLHPFIELALEVCGMYQDAPVRRVRIYTDGSAATTSAWSVVVLAETVQRELQLVGTFQHEVDVFGDNLIAGDKHGNQEAELTALAWAFVWALQSCYEDFAVYSDSLTSVNLLQGEAASAGHDKLCQVVLALYVALGKERMVTVAHVRGHSGNPWNELADAMARAAEKGIDRTSNLPRIQGRFEEARWLPHVGELQEGRCFPLIVGDKISVQPAFGGESKQAESPWVPRGRAKRQCRGGEEGLCCRVATANVMTLGRYKEEGLNVVGRAAVLMKQCKQAMLDMVGVQEARTKQGIRECEDYIVVAGGCMEGHAVLGCELWLAKEWANGEVRMNCKDVQVVLAKPRILHVSLTATSLKVDVVVIHAPHHGRPEDEQAGFWDDLDRVMRGCAWTAKESSWPTRMRTSAVLEKGPSAKPRTSLAIGWGASSWSSWTSTSCVRRRPSRRWPLLSTIGRTRGRRISTSSTMSSSRRRPCGTALGRALWMWT